MATINVGKIRPTHQGEYSASTAYSFLDWVTYEGSSYVCINLTGAPAGTAVTNQTYWACLAQKGDTGATGATGANGTTPTFSIGTVTTGAAGSSASVTISGTAPNYVLNFTIPQGATGATGASGTFTGPLMPTTSYWTTATYSSTSVLTPSGGTWAYVYIGQSSEVNGSDGGSTTYYNVLTVSIAAGGTTISTQSTTALARRYANATLCWRIQ